MKKIHNVFSSFLTVGCVLAVSSTGYAAVCNNTQGTIAAPPATPTSILGTANNCGHNSNYNGSTFCGGVSFSSAGTDVYQVTMGNSLGLTFTVASPGTNLTPVAFTPDIALLKTSCATTDEEARRQIQGISQYGSFQSLPELMTDACESCSVPLTGETALSYRGLPYDLREDLLPRSSAWKDVTLSEATRGRGGRGSDHVTHLWVRR